MQRKTIMERMENEKRKQKAEFHIDRTPGRDCNHCHIGGIVAAGFEQSQRIRQENFLRE